MRKSGDRFSESSCCPPKTSRAPDRFDIGNDCALRRWRGSSKARSCQAATRCIAAFSRAPWIALHRFFDRRPQPADFGGGKRVGSYSLAPSPSASASEKFARWVIWPPQTGMLQAEQSFARVRHHRQLGVLPARRRAVDDDRIGLAHLRAKATVSFTASRSNTPGRHGTTTSVAARIASVTLADIFGAVSTKTHSVPSRLAALTISPTPRSAALQRQLGVVAQFVPERERSLRIGVDEETGPRRVCGHRRQDAPPPCSCPNHPCGKQRQ